MAGFLNVSNTRMAGEVTVNGMLKGSAGIRRRLAFGHILRDKEQKRLVLPYAPNG